MRQFSLQNKSMGFHKAMTTLDKVLENINEMEMKSSWEKNDVCNWVSNGIHHQNPAGMSMENSKVGRRNKDIEPKF